MVSKYLETNWIGVMTESLQLLHPELPEKEIEDFVIEEYYSRVKDHNCMIYNNYENLVVNTTLGGVLDWIQKERPLIAESGVFFYPKSKKRNINIEIIKECMLDARAVHKAEMFAALDIGDMFTASVKEIQQGNDKKAANSGYGAEGEHSSFLFNYHSAMSVTACGRAQLSTAMNCFENLLGDFVKFFNMDEFFTAIHNTVHEVSNWTFKTFEIVNRVPSRKKWIQRFTSKFLHHSMYDEDRIAQVYDALSDELRTRTYYKANLRAFLVDNFVPNNLFSKIAEIKCDFVDPNKIPDAIADKLDTLAKMVTEFVNYKHNPFRYEDRARYQKRAVVTVMD